MSTPPTDSEHAPSEPTDFARILGEIDEEVRRRRANGDFPDELLEEIDAEMRSHAPVTHQTNDLEGAVRDVEAAALIDVDAPVDEERASNRYVKQGVKRLTGWYQMYVAGQVTHLGLLTARPLRVIAGRLQELDDRLSRLEDQGGPEPSALLSMLPVIPLPARAASAVAPHLGDTSLRVAVGHDDGRLVDELRTMGLDAYACAPDSDALSPDDRHRQDLAAHLASLPERTLGGLLIVRQEGLRTPAGASRLCQLAISRVVPGGGVVVLAADPGAWRDAAGVLHADLSAGPALHPETWAHLFLRAGGKAEIMDLDDRTAMVVARQGLSQMTAVHQLIASFSARDAVGNHTVLAREALQRAGYESEIFAEATAPGVPVRSRPARELPPDSAVVYQMSIGSRASELYRRHRGRRILNYHNITPAEFFDGWEPRVVSEIVIGRHQLADLAAFTDHAIAVSDYNRLELQRLGYRSTSTVPVLHQIRAAPRPDAAPPPGPTRILFVGRLVPNKAQHDLLRAFAVYRTTFDRAARLDLVGSAASPAYGRALRAVVGSTSDLEQAVCFYDSVSDAGLAALYGGASLFCCLSDHEGFGVPLVEAMAHGVPVVAYASSAVGETVGDGGLLLPRKDPATVATAWNRVLTDPAVRRRLVAAGHRRVRAFDVDLISAAFVADVEGALERRRLPVSHVGFVTPRYGDVIGGSEFLVRRLAEGLVALERHRVEVFTTCAADAHTFADEFSPGTTVERGVTVHRFRSRGRDPRLAEVAARVTFPGAMSEQTARRFFEWQGPYCPEMIDGAAASGCDVVVFAPYPYWPAIEGPRVLGERAVIHGAVHDEATLYLSPTAESFLAAGGFVFNSRAEQALVRRVFAIGHRPQLVLGGGMEDPPPERDDELVRRTAGLDGTPYVVCLGRVERAKGADVLFELFRAYKSRRPGPLRLVFVGPASHRFDHPDVVMTGAVDNETKWAILRGAQVCISPSAMESFSMVVVESWQAGVPPLVNALCPATVEHCSESRGGLWFEDYPTFEVALDRLLADPELRDHLAGNGLRYASQRFQWPDLVHRYSQFLERHWGDTSPRARRARTAARR